MVDIEENIPLSRLTTFALGGPTRFLAHVRTQAELQEAFDFARARGLKTFVLGGGSNVLAPDQGYGGLTLRVETKGIAFKEDADEVLVVSEAGESWDELVESAVRNDLWGIENLSGIPGTVGAAPVQNIGAYGSELKDCLAWVDAYDTHTGSVEQLAKSECGFGYRTSRFKKDPGRYVVLRVALRLSKRSLPKLSYKDLSERFANVSAPSLSEIRHAILEIRRVKFPDLSKEGTAGSFFLNPIVSHERARVLAQAYEGVPMFETREGIKISLAWLLDRVLALRGHAYGHARLFERQPIVIVASREASSEEVMKLADEIISLVEKKFNLKIEIEVQVLK